MGYGDDPEIQAIIAHPDFQRLPPDEQKQVLKVVKRGAIADNHLRRELEAMPGRDRFDWIHKLPVDARINLSEAIQRQAGQRGLVTGYFAEHSPTYRESELDSLGSFLEEQGVLRRDAGGKLVPADEIGDGEGESKGMGTARRVVHDTVGAGIRGFRAAGEITTDAVKRGAKAVGVPPGVADAVAPWVGGAVEYAPLQMVPIPGTTFGAPAVKKGLAGLRELFTIEGAKNAAKRTLGAGVTGAGVGTVQGSVENFGNGEGFMPKAEQIVGGAEGFMAGHGLIGEVGGPMVGAVREAPGRVRQWWNWRGGSGYGGAAPREGMFPASIEEPSAEFTEGMPPPGGMAPESASTLASLGRGGAGRAQEPSAGAQPPHNTPSTANTIVRDVEEATDLGRSAAETPTQTGPTGLPAEAAAYRQRASEAEAAGDPDTAARHSYVADALERQHARNTQPGAPEVADARTPQPATRLARAREAVGRVFGAVPNPEAVQPPTIADTVKVAPAGDRIVEKERLAAMGEPPMPPGGITDADITGASGVGAPDYTRRGDHTVPLESEGRPLEPGSAVDPAFTGTGGLQGMDRLREERRQREAGVWPDQQRFETPADFVGGDTGIDLRRPPSGDPAGREFQLGPNDRSLLKQRAAELAGHPDADLHEMLSPENQRRLAQGEYLQPVTSEGAPDPAAVVLRQREAERRAADADWHAKRGLGRYRARDMLRDMAAAQKGDREALARVQAYVEARRGPGNPDVRDMAGAASGKPPERGRPPGAGGRTPSPRPQTEADSGSGTELDRAALRRGLLQSNRHVETWDRLRRQGLSDGEVLDAAREALNDRSFGKGNERAAARAVREEMGVWPRDVQAVVNGEARAWLRPPKAEGTVPTASEAEMADVDLARFAKERGLGHFMGGDGTELLYDPSQVRRGELHALDAEGKLPDVVNGAGTSPKPAEPRGVVVVRDQAGREVRTIVVADDAAAKIAVEAQPPGFTTEVLTDPDRIRAILDERRAGAPKSAEVSEGQADGSRPESSAPRADAVDPGETQGVRPAEPRADVGQTDAGGADVTGGAGVRPDAERPAGDRGAGRDAGTAAPDAGRATGDGLPDGPAGEGVEGGRPAPARQPVAGSGSKPAVAGADDPAGSGGTRGRSRPGDDAGDVGGGSPPSRTHDPDDPVVDTRPDLAKPVDDSIVPARLRDGMRPHQRQGAAKMLRSLFDTEEDARRAGILADATGAGKSTQILAIGEGAISRGKKVLVVAPAAAFEGRDWNSRQFAGSYADDAKRMGIDVALVKEGGEILPGRVNLTTYEMLDKVESAIDRDTVIVWDESHYLKNGDAARAIVGGRMSDAAYGVINASATPGDKISHLPYMRRALLRPGERMDALMRALGLEAATDRGKISWRQRKGVSADDVKRNIQKRYDELVSTGRMVERAIPWNGVEMRFEFHQMPAEVGAQQKAIEDFLSYRDTNFPREAKPGDLLGHLRRQQEVHKIPMVVDYVQKELAAGRQVVLFAHRVNESSVRRRPLDSNGRPMKSESDVKGAGPWEYMDGGKSEGTLRLLADALRKAGIEDFVALHGGKTESKQEVLRKFQSGEARVLLTNPESGGIGVNADDRVGNRPRTVIMMTAPYGGTENVQALGRVHRLTTRSLAKVVYLYSTEAVDAHNASVVGKKLAMMGAMVRGVAGIKERSAGNAVPPAVNVDRQGARAYAADPTLPTPAIQLPDGRTYAKPGVSYKELEKSLWLTKERGRVRGTVNPGGDFVPVETAPTKAPTVAKPAAPAAEPAAPPAAKLGARDQGESSQGERLSYEEFSKRMRALHVEDKALFRDPKNADGVFIKPDTQRRRNRIAEEMTDLDSSHPEHAERWREENQRFVDDLYDDGAGADAEGKGGEPPSKKPAPASEHGYFVSQWLNERGRALDASKRELRSVRAELKTMRDGGPPREDRAARREWVARRKALRAQVERLDARIKAGGDSNLQDLSESQRQALIAEADRRMAAHRERGHGFTSVDDPAMWKKQEREFRKASDYERLSERLRQTSTELPPAPGTSAETPERMPESRVGKTERVMGIGIDKPVEATGRYVLVEAEDLLTSHDRTGRENKSYPQQWQDRARDRVDKILGLVKNAKVLDPEALGPNAWGADGRPIVVFQNVRGTMRPVVLSGNGRTLSLLEAYDRDLPSAERYRDYLIENAHPRFGLSMHDVITMKHPVVVLETDLARAKGVATLDELASRFNQRQQAQMSASESASADKKSLTPDALAVLTLQRDGSADLTSASNAPFVDAFLRKFPDTERGAWMTADGRGLNADGIKRMERALFAKAYETGSRETDGLVERLTLDSKDDTARAITNALSRLAPRMAKIRSMIEDGRLYDLGIADELAKAASTVASLKERGEKIDDYLKTPDMLRDPITTRLLEVMRDVGRKTTRLDEVLNHYLDGVEDAGNPRQAGMFDKPQSSKLELLNDAISAADLPSAQGAMFDRTYDDPSKAPESDVEAMRAATENESRALAKAKRQAMSDYAAAERRGDSERMMQEKNRLAYMGVAEKVLDHYMEQVSLAEADLKLAQRGGNKEEIKRASERLDMIRRGVRPVEGSAGDAESSRLNELGMALGLKTDDRIKVAPLPTVSRLKAFFSSPGALARKFSHYRDVMDLVAAALDEQRRYNKILLERESISGRPGTGGFRTVLRAVRAANQLEPLRTALIYGDYLRDHEARRPTEAELRERGLNDVGIAAYRSIDRSMQTVWSLVNRMREVNGLPRLPKIEGTYAPHKWMGSFQLVANGRVLHDARSGQATFATMHEARMAGLELLKRAPDLSIVIEPRYREWLNDLPEVAELRAMNRWLAKMEDVDRVDLAKEVRDFMGLDLRTQGFNKHLELRQGKEGWDKEKLFDGYDLYLRQLARNLPRAARRKEIQAKMNAAVRDGLAQSEPFVHEAMADAIQWFEGKQTRAERVVDDALRRVPMLKEWLNPVRPTAALLGGARDIVFHSKVAGFNWAFYPIQLAQNITHSGPIVGYDNLSKGTSGWLNPSREQAQWIQRMDRRGILEPQFTHGELWGSTKATERLKEFSTTFANLGERHNRTITGLATIERVTKLKPGANDRLLRFAYDGDSAKVANFDPKNINQVLDVVARVNARTHFRYDVTDRPAFMRGPFAQTLFQFKQFSTNTWEMYRRFIDAKAGGENEKEVSPILKSLAATALLTGVMGLPAAQSLDELIRFATGNRVKPLDTAFDNLPSYAMRGVPALARIDISRRLGQGDFIPSQPRDFLPPLLTSLWQLHDDLIAGDPLKVMGDASPATATLARSIQRFSGERRNARGRLISTPDYYDAMIGLSGYRPLKESEAQQALDISVREARQHRADRMDAMDRIGEAVRTGKPVGDIIREAASKGIRITPRAVRESVAAQKQSTAERVLANTPKDIRRSVQKRLAPEIDRERAARVLKSWGTK